MYLYQSFVSSHNFDYIHKINTLARLVGRASQYRKLTLKLHLTLGSDFELIIVGTYVILFFLCAHQYIKFWS